MEMGQSTLAALRSVVTAVNVPVYLKVVVQADRHAVWYIDAIVAAPTAPENWQPAVWDYAPATFIAGAVSSGALASALDPYDAQGLPLSGYNLTLPVLAPQVNWQHRPSRARFDSMVFPWPTHTFSLYLPNNPQRQPLQGYLIGDDCPSFPAYESAFRAFFYDDYSRPSGSGLPNGFGDIRIVLGAAWLERIRVTPTSIDVHVGGTQAAGTRLELNSPTYRTDIRVDETGRAKLPIPDGLPAGAWLYLSRDRQWLDYRAFSDFHGQADLATAGVDVEVPEDPEIEIQALLTRGEGQQIEFKRQPPDDTVESKRTVFKTVAAFANGSGGSIVFGIDSDEATVRGLEGVDPKQERDRLAQLARSIVVPAPGMEVRQYELEGKLLLVRSVEPGPNPPYGITLPGRSGKPVEFYVRRDATTFPAKPDEIRTTVLTSAPAPVQSPMWGAGG
jgi:Putative DNA-binding domain